MTYQQLIHEQQQRRADIDERNSNRLWTVSLTFCGGLLVAMFLPTFPLAALLICAGLSWWGLASFLGLEQRPR